MGNERRGVVYIAPTANYLPSGRMVDPARSPFYVHWEDWDADAARGGMLEDGGSVEAPKPQSHGGGHAAIAF